MAGRQGFCIGKGASDSMNLRAFWDSKSELDQRDVYPDPVLGKWDGRREERRPGALTRAPLGDSTPESLLSHSLAGVSITFGTSYFDRSPDLALHGGCIAWSSDQQSTGNHTDFCLCSWPLVPAWPATGPSLTCSYVTVVSFSLFKFFNNS